MRPGAPPKGSGLRPPRRRRRSSTPRSRRSPRRPSRRQRCARPGPSPYSWSRRPGAKWGPAVRRAGPRSAPAPSLVQPSSAGSRGPVEIGVPGEAAAGETVISRVPRRPSPPLRGPPARLPHHDIPAVEAGGTPSNEAADTAPEPVCSEASSAEGRPLRGPCVSEGGVGEDAAEGQARRRWYRHGRARAGRDALRAGQPPAYRQPPRPRPPGERLPTASRWCPDGAKCTPDAAARDATMCAPRRRASPAPSG